jgi:hypothetical protein
MEDDVVENCDDRNHVGRVAMEMMMTATNAG